MKTARSHNSNSLSTAKRAQTPPPLLAPPSHRLQHGSSKGPFRVLHGSFPGLLRVPLGSLLGPKRAGFSGSDSPQLNPLTNYSTAFTKNKPQKQTSKTIFYLFFHPTKSNFPKLILLLLLLLLLTLPLQAAPLPIDSLYPAGGQRNTTLTLTLSGKFEKQPLQIWADTASLKFEPTKTPNQFTVKIPADAPLGPHLLRVYSADEVSTVRSFIISDQPETPEAEPNDEFNKPQPIDKLPALINAQLDKSGDIDCYAIHLEANQTLVASIQGRRLGSAIDPMLHLLDPAGNELAYAQDGLGLDPLLVYRVAKSGKYIVRVSAFFYPPAADVKLAGGKDAVYRLSLTTGPFVRFAIPMGVVRGQKSTVHFIGYNLAPENAQANTAAVDATSALPQDDHLYLPVPGSESPLRIELSDAPEIMPTTATTQPILTLPVNINGLINHPGVEDHFKFSAKKGDPLTFAIRAEAAGSPLDAVLKIIDDAGKTIASNDDPSGPSHDPKLDWDTPKDGTCTVQIGDLFHKAGPDYFYRLEIKKRLPEITAAPDSDAYLLAPGKSVPIKLQITRKNGHAAPFAAVALNLPPGVSASTAQLPPSSGEVTLLLTAAPDTKPASAPIRLMLLGINPAKPEARVISYDLHKDKDKPGIPDSPDTTPDLWLTVSPQPPKPAPAK